MKFKHLLNELGLFLEVVDTLGILVGEIAEETGAVPVANELPVSLAHGPPVAPAPVQGAMARWSIWLLNEG